MNKDKIIHKDIRNDFPILSKKILMTKDLVYFDTAASAQKPQVVINELNQFYKSHYSNVSRGVHTLSVESTLRYEDARKKVQKFVNAKSENEIIFTKSATESINLVAQTFYDKYMSAGDEIILSLMEHHSNLIPWYFLRDKYGVVIKFANITESGEIDVNHFESLITSKTKIAALTHLSNVYGSKVDEKVSSICKRNNVAILLDGCQSAAHLKIDVQKLECDFFVFSGHKTYGPSGIGILYGKESLLNEMPPYQGGGGMIGEVTTYAYEKISELDFVKIYGDGENRNSIISFNIENIHSHEVSSFLDVEGIAVRAGHHCCQPLMKHLGVNSTSRLSFGMYNTIEEVDIFINALIKCKEFFIK